MSQSLHRWWNERHAEEKGRAYDIGITINYKEARGRTTARKKAVAMEGTHEGTSTSERVIPIHTFIHLPSCVHLHILFSLWPDTKEAATCCCRQDRECLFENVLYIGLVGNRTDEWANNEYSRVFDVIRLSTTARAGANAFTSLYLSPHTFLWVSKWGNFSRIETLIAVCVNCILRELSCREMQSQLAHFPFIRIQFCRSASGRQSSSDILTRSLLLVWCLWAWKKGEIKLKRVCFAFSEMSLIKHHRMMAAALGARAGTSNIAAHTYEHFTRSLPSLKYFRQQF